MPSTTNNPAAVAAVSTTTLAKRWDCCGRSIRNLIEDGSLPAFRVGKMLRIPMWAVEQIEEHGSIITPPPIETVQPASAPVEPKSAPSGLSEERRFQINAARRVA